MYCNSCGAANPDDAKFCRGCGRPIPARATPPAPAPVEEHAPEVARTAPAPPAPVLRVELPDAPQASAPSIPAATRAAQPKRRGMVVAFLVAIVAVLAIGVWMVARSRANRPIRFVGHSDWIFSVAFRPDGLVLASGSDDTMIKLWEPATGKLLRSIGPTYSSRFVAFTPDGRLLAGSDARSPMEERKVRVWDVATGQIVLDVTPAAAEWIGPPAFSPDGRLMAAPVRVLHGASTAAVVWNVASGGVVRTFPDAGSQIFFGPDGRTLIASAAGGHAINVFELASGALLRSFREPHLIQSAAISGDGQMLAVTTFDSATAEFDADIHLWDLGRGQQVRTIHDTAGVILTAVSPNGRLLASGARDNMVRLWDLESGRILKTLAGHATPSTCLAFSPDGTRLASGDANAHILMWRIGR